MLSSDRRQRLTALRETVADIERKPVMADGSKPFPSHPDMFPALPAGSVQEIYTDGARDSGGSLAFALIQAMRLLGTRRSVIFYVQLADEAQFFGLPYGPGLSWLGLDPERLVIVRAANMAEFLWATEEATSCRAVAAIIAEVRGSSKLLNFTASRRLSLRASANRVSLFLLRYGRRRESSAASLRWQIIPHRSSRNVFDDRAPGNARWHLRLERGRMGGNQTDWMLEARKSGLAIFSAQPAIAGRPRSDASVPGAASALLGNRLSQAS